MAEEQDRSLMELLEPLLAASVGITRLWALLGSGARVTLDLTACSLATRGRRSTGHQAWTTTPGSSGLGPGPVCPHTAGGTRDIN